MPILVMALTVCATVTGDGFSGAVLYFATSDRLVAATTWTDVASLSRCEFWTHTAGPSPARKSPSKSSSERLSIIDVDSRHQERIVSTSDTNDSNRGPRSSARHSGHADPAHPAG